MPQAKLLGEAEDLHNHSLSLALLAFGENNVQTAKHYGNLGRLYQSMGQFRKAEEMHLKAIEIKERLLGLDDYEVALSVGHLASLYNYDMQMYDKAEELYFRSIKIGKKLFGDGYSGLEYDYRGLLRLYHSMRNYEGALEYQVSMIVRKGSFDRSGKVTAAVLLYSLHICLSHLLRTSTLIHTRFSLEFSLITSHYCSTIDLLNLSQAKLHDWSELRDELSNGGSDLKRQNPLADRLGSDSNAQVTAEVTDLETLKRQFFGCPHVSSMQ